MRLPLLPLLLALAALRGAGRAADPDALAPHPEELRAIVVEHDGDTVEVWIALPAGIDPGSVEVQLAGRFVGVRARDENGRELRSATLRLRDAVVEEGATARSEGTWLIVQLRKESPPPTL